MLSRRSTPITAGLVCALSLSLAVVPDVLADATKDVVVDNTLTNPVGVTSADDPARQPFQQEIFIKSFNKPVPVLTVPVGGRLVLDFFSAESFVPSGQTVSRFFICARDPNANTTSFCHIISPISHGPSEGQDVFIASQQMELFVDPARSWSSTRLAIAPAGARLRALAVIWSNCHDHSLQRVELWDRDAPVGDPARSASERRLATWGDAK